VILEGHGINAYFKQNDNLIDWVKKQPMTRPVSCIGDGHDGIWNILVLPELPWYFLHLA
jgi:hypothetical protein